MFFLTHKQISKSLVNASTRGVKIRIILDATGATNAYSKHRYLRDHGIPVKVENWGGKMHMKAAVIDQRHLVFGSMNWTAAGESKNDENMIIAKDAPRQAQTLTLFFEELWASIPDRWQQGAPRPESTDSGTACHDALDNDFDGAIDAADPGCARESSN